MIHRIRTWENLHFINPIPNQLQRFYVLKNSLFVDQEYSASRALCISNILSREELYLVNCDSPNERKKDSGNFHVYFYACIHTHTHKRPCKKKKRKNRNGRSFSTFSLRGPLSRSFIAARFIFTRWWFSTTRRDVSSPRLNYQFTESDRGPRFRIIIVAIRAGTSTRWSQVKEKTNLFGIEEPLIVSRRENDLLIRVRTLIADAERFQGSGCR